MKVRGFSLLELIMVMAIMAILLSVGIFKANPLETYKAKNQIKELALNIDYVRNFSQRTGTRSSLLINNEGYSFDLGGEKNEIKFSKLLEVYEKNLDKITFTELGKPAFPKESNTSGHIIFKIKDKFYKITVVPVTGKVNFYNNYTLEDEEKNEGENF